VKTKRQLSGAIQPLRLQQALDALLTERLGVQSQMIEPAQRTAEDLAANGHCVPPHARIDAESSEDRRCTIIDGAPFVCAHDATGPIDELEIALERERDRRSIRRHFIAESKQLLRANELRCCRGLSWPQRLDACVDREKRKGDRFIFGG
jgi:hypothetical protein